MPYFKMIDGCKLYYELIGDGPGKPVVTFINGTLQTTAYWKTVAKSLENRYRLLLYDCRGQGASDPGDANLTLKRHADDLKELLYELGIHRTHIVGLSHGARVALALGAERAELVARLVLCSISTRSTYRAKMIVRSWLEILKRHSLDAMVWAALPHVFGDIYLRKNSKILDRIVNTIVRRNRAEALRAHLEAMQHYAPLRSILQKTPFLVLVLTGDDDPLVTPEGANEIANLCGGRHQALAGIGHSLPAEAPEVFVDSVRSFLDGG